MTHRYAIVGAGMRARMYVDAIVGPHAGEAQLVALVDVNEGRLGVHADRVVAAGAPRPVTCGPAELERVIASEAVERVIVATPDATHAGLVARSLQAGADVVVEKPLTVDEPGCRAIAETVRSTGRSVVVTFNYRYSPRNAALKELIAAGAIGTVTSVHFEWLLDTQHGADYFRRWHRDKANSGGLLVHKASHHFDLVNWWIDDTPRLVFARGGLRFYGDANSRVRGMNGRPPRGSVDSAADDPFALDLRADPVLKALYYDNERFDGYRRDQDVFSPGISIEDNLSLVVEYRRGPSMSYSLNAHAPWEGYTVGVNGTRGRAELTVVERGAVGSNDTIDVSASPDVGRSDSVRPVGERLVLQRQWEGAHVVDIPEGHGGHGGGDGGLLNDIFVGPGPDPLGRAADWIDGVRSVAVGIAGNRSLATGLPVRVGDLELGVDLAEQQPSVRA